MKNLQSVLICPVFDHMAIRLPIFHTLLSIGAPNPRPALAFKNVMRSKTGMRDNAETSPPMLRQPRAAGSAMLRARASGAKSVIGDLRQEGALKLVFPRSRSLLQGVLLNMAGGVTGGDRLQLEAAAGPGTHLQLTTQASERAYRAAGDEFGVVRTRLSAEAGARLDWLPQELILFEGCALRRSLRIDLEGDARLLMAEPVIFGRASMGEELKDAAFHDRIAVYRDNALIWLDRVRLEGDIAAQLDRPAIAAGAGAMASVLYVAPDAEGRISDLRRILPPRAAASLLAPDIIAIRILAVDGFTLRQSLLPALDLLSDDALPISWRL